MVTKPATTSTPRDDVADLLGVSAVTVGRRVHEARLFVRERLSGAFRLVAS